MNRQMTDVWQQLQPLRIPAGWLIEYNNFYKYEPTAENMDWFYGSYVLCASSQRAKLAFESRYEPEGDPKGALIIDFFATDSHQKGELADTYLGSRSTGSKQEFIDFIEHFMFFQELPPEKNDRQRLTDTCRAIKKLLLEQENEPCWLECFDGFLNNLQDEHHHLSKIQREIDGIFKGSGSFNDLVLQKNGIINEPADKTLAALRRQLSFLLAESKQV